MDVALFCVVLLGLAAFVAAPLYRTTTAANPSETLDAGREASRRALAELEIDRASGLLDDAAYEAERATLETPTD